MAWSVPLTAVSNATLTAAQWNASVRDNLLETAPAKATTAGSFFATTGANAIAQRTPDSTVVSTNQTTTATTFGDLTTVGPAVTVTTGTTALILYGCWMTNDTAGARSCMSYGITGASSGAAQDATSAIYEPYSAGKYAGFSRVIFQTSLTAGSNTFTAKYKVSSGTGTFQQRSLAVVPF